MHWVWVNAGISIGIPGISILVVISHLPSLSAGPAKERETVAKHTINMTAAFRIMDVPPGYMKVMFLKKGYLCMIDSALSTNTMSGMKISAS
jgi:hypothetical protein